jgi:osmotically-inducible protein OsmY
MTSALGDEIVAARALGAPVRSRKAVNSRSVESADRSLRRAVLTRLIADQSVCAGHIAVAASAGRVTLLGHVTSHEQKAAASAATRRVAGVERVVNDVGVAVPTSSPAGAGRSEFRP